MRKIGYLGFLILAVSFQIFAQEKKFDESVLSEKGKESYKTLLSVELFAIGGIGYGGETSNGELAFRVLMVEKEGISVFRNLVKYASPEGGLYALLGLKLLNCQCFKQELVIFKALPEPDTRTENGRKIEKGNVRRMSGCIGYQESRLKVARDIELERDGMKWISKSKAKREQ